MRIEEATEASDELVDAVGRLLPQLSATTPLPGRRDLEELVESPATTLLLARDAGGDVVGMVTLVLFRIPTGLRARIEDVVVDASARGGGVGEALTRDALRRAREAGARSVELTSHPSRAAANRLYARIGFQRRDTNIFRLAPLERAQDAATALGEDAT